MNENNAGNLRNMTTEELESKLRHLREEQFNLRFRNSVQQLDNPLALRKIRRDIARVETVLNEHRKGIRAVAAKTKS